MSLEKMTTRTITDCLFNVFAWLYIHIVISNTFIRNLVKWVSWEIHIHTNISQFRHYGCETCERQTCVLFKNGSRQPCQLHLNRPFRTTFFIRNINVCLQFMLYLHNECIHSWNPSSRKTRTYLVYLDDVMAADVPVTKGATASATMVLAQLYRDNQVPAS